MIFVRIFLIKYNFYLCQLITIYVLLYIMFIRNVGCLLHIKIMNFGLDKISNKINQILIKRLENSLSRRHSPAIARKFNFHEGTSQSRSFSTRKRESIQNFSFRLFRNLFNFPSGGQFSRLDFIKKGKFPDPAEFRQRFTWECIIISLLRPCCNSECAYLEKQAAEAEDIFYRPEEAGRLRCCLVLSGSRHSPEQEKFSQLCSRMQNLIFEQSFTIVNFVKIFQFSFREELYYLYFYLLIY